MAKLELTLFNADGESVTYTENQVSGQKLLDFFNLQIDIEKNSKKLTLPDIIAKKAEYVAGLFKHRDVTAESIIQGVNSWDLLDTLDKLISIAIGGEDSPKTESDSIQKSPEVDI